MTMLEPIPAVEVEERLALQVQHVRHGDGMRLWTPEEPPADLVDGQGPPLSTYTFMATEETTGGSLSLVHTEVPPGNGPPTHRHADADESFYILEGEFEVTSGGRQFVASPGDFVFIPRGTDHIWKNSGSSVSRMIRIYTPGGIERFFAAISRPAVAGEPAPRLTAEDVERAEAIARQHYA